MHLVLDPSFIGDPKFLHSLAAHEVSHVLSFVHEHQRIDRDDYVNYNCMALYDYGYAEKEVAAHPEWNRDMSEICASNFLATNPELEWYGPSNYSKDMGTAFPMSNRQTTSDDFDFPSITLYPFWLHTHEGDDLNDLNDPNDLPIVKWIKTGPDALSQWEFGRWYSLHSL